jgi:ferredoxin
MASTEYRQERSAVRIQVDVGKCSGHARCNAISPTVFHLNDEGYNDMDECVLEDNEVAEASRGVLACPEGAITLVDPGGRLVPEEELQILAKGQR